MVLDSFALGKVTKVLQHYTMKCDSTVLFLSGINQQYTILSVFNYGNLNGMYTGYYILITHT